MISIIICSQHPQIPPVLENNIKETIGVEYEIIYIYNDENKYSIFKAYNLGVERSRGDILCFMHDDVEYLSRDWGISVKNILSLSDVGACAVAGAKYMRQSPSYYPIGGRFNAINLVQSNIDGKQVWHDCLIPTDVVVFDGLWFCIKREMFAINRITFDAQNYAGFHFYDIDIATQIINKGKRILILPDVRIKHNSGGTTNKEWLRNSFIYAKKWQNSLPLSCVAVESNEALRLEQKALYSSIRVLLKTGSFDLLFQWIQYACRINHTTPIIAFVRILRNHIQR